MAYVNLTNVKEFASIRHMNASVFIYGLVDPRTDEIRYIGKTKKKLSDRLSEHIAESKFLHRTDYRSNWIRSLLKLDLKLLTTLLEEVSADDWQWYEKWWIKYGKIVGWRLTNGTSGGDGGFTFTEESIKRMSESHSGEKNHNYGKHHTEEDKKKKTKTKSCQKRNDSFRGMENKYK